MLLNWRFQQMLYRAYYDAYVKRRLIHETNAESAALDLLRKAAVLGPAAAMAQAEDILDRTAAQSPADDLRLRIHALAEALYQSARLQSSVSRYKTAAPIRSATLDALDAPLNNRAWLKWTFARIRAMKSGQQGALDALIDWTNPGPGGYYDDLGNPQQQPHLVRGQGFAKDPGNRQTALSAFGSRDDEPHWRISWMTHAETLFGPPLELEYPNLDPGAQYRLRVVYGGAANRSPDKMIRLMANGQYEVHGYRQRDIPARAVEFDIPRQATATGRLRLSWSTRPGGEEAIRGAEVAEVWLIREKR